MSTRSSTGMVVTPAPDERESIAGVIRALLIQEHPADLVAVASGCTDDTVEVARAAAGDDPSVVVWELPALAHRRSEALNRAWARWGREDDYLVCLDGDTELPANAVGDWVVELDANPTIGGAAASSRCSGTTC